MWLSGLSIAVLEPEKWPLEVYIATGSVVTKNPPKDVRANCLCATLLRRERDCNMSRITSRIGKTFAKTVDDKSCTALDQRR